MCTKWLDVSSGVRQGDSLSTFLFSLFTWFKGELKAICMLILKVQLDVEKYFAVKENV